MDPTKAAKNAMKPLLKNRRTLWALISLATVAIALIALYLYYPGRSGGPAPAAVLREGPMSLTVEADALIESAGKSEIYAPSSLKVKEVIVKEGDYVAVGETLAVLDTEALELEIERAELNIRSAQANMTNEQTALGNSVTSARNALSSAEVSLQTARREHASRLEREGAEESVIAARLSFDAAWRAYEYNLSLFQIGGVSREALSQSENALDKARSARDDAERAAKEALDRAREALDAAVIRHKAAGDALDEALEKNTDPAAIALDLQKVAYQEKLIRLRDAEITAGQAGVVTLANAKEGAPASGLMFIIEDEKNLIVRAKVGEVDVGSLKPGVRCAIAPSGWDGTIGGTVKLIPPSAWRDASGAFAAVIGDDVFFMVEASVDEWQPGLRIGMNAKVSFIIEEKEACFSVPKGLIYRDGELKWVVTRDNAGKFIRVFVRTGLETRRVCEIISDELYEGMELYNIN